LQNKPKQSTREQNTFLNHLNQFNAGQINQNKMIQETVKHGFNYVLDAFHNVHGQEVKTRFFIDERRSKNAIQLTDEFMRLGEDAQFISFEHETEARWRLVEAAWEANVSRNLLLVNYESKTKQFIDMNPLRRTALTSASPALNGYQKGRCFYCYRDISIIQGHEHTADVDHFFPHILKQCDSDKPIDGVANLVLACQECNRGKGGKFERLPSVNLVDRLFTRNEYLISSHHPLRETLIAQTGNTMNKRQGFLQDAYNCSTLFVGSSAKWEPQPQGDAVF
jgi:5-methylcytosine-specific restriction endonuclease McrA